MLGTKAKSHQSLERSIAKYEAKLAKAPNPTQRQYASSMLRMAKAALETSLSEEPAKEPAGDDIVTLHQDEYSAT